MKAALEPEPATKSLKDVAVAESVKAFLASDSPGRDWDGLEAVQQKLLFQHLLAEHRRLLQTERRLASVQSWLPTTDLAICTVRQRCDDAAYERNEAFARAWTPVDEMEARHSRRDPTTVMWSTWDVYSPTPDAPLEVRPYTQRSPADLRSGRDFHHCISSHLLLYRCIALFGLDKLDGGERYKSNVGPRAALGGREELAAHRRTQGDGERAFPGARGGEPGGDGAAEPSGVGGAARDVRRHDRGNDGVDPLR